MLAIKTLGLVLLSAVSLDYVAVFFATDIGSYLLIKIIRGDFIYWLRLEGITGILMSLIIRVVVKVINDFITIIQFRHPNEVGGAQSVFGQLTSVATLFIALILAEDSGKLGYEMDRLWHISYILPGAALFSYILFFTYINKSYTRTFYTLETGGQMTITNFREHEDDGLKSDIFNVNKNQWKSIYEEVKDWIWQNWPKWVEEKPAWFDDKMRSMIPQDMIPSSDDPKQIAAEGQKKISRAASNVKTSKGQEMTMIGRIQTQASSLLGGGKANKKSNKVVPEEEGGFVEKDDDVLLAIGRMKTFSGL